MYKGYPSLLIFGVPKNYVRFFTYSLAKKHLFTNGTRIDNLLSGFLAGFMDASLVVTPM